MKHAPILLALTMVLGLLVPAVAYAQKTGPIRWTGTLYFNGSPVPGTELYGTTYLIPSGTQVVVQPGARLLFGPNYMLVVEGELLVQGEKNAPVYALALDKVRGWRGILIQGSASHAHLQYFIMEEFRGYALRITDTHIVAHHIHLTSSYCMGLLYLKHASGCIHDVNASATLRGMGRVKLAPDVTVRRAAIAVYLRRCHSVSLQNIAINVQGYPGCSVLGLLLFNSSNIHVVHSEVKVFAQVRVLPPPPRTPPGIPPRNAPTFSEGGSSSRLNPRPPSSKLRVVESYGFAATTDCSNIHVKHSVFQAVGKGHATYVAAFYVTERSCHVHVDHVETYACSEGKGTACAFWVENHAKHVYGEHLSLTARSSVSGTAIAIWVETYVSKLHLAHVNATAIAGNGSLSHPNGGEALGFVLRSSRDVQLVHVSIQAHGGDGVDGCATHPNGGSGGPAIGAMLECSECSATHAVFAAYGGDGGDAYGANGIPGDGGDATALLLIESYLYGKYTTIEEDGVAGT